MGLAAGKANFGDVHLTKYVDQYSPNLFSYLVAGTPLTATLAWVTTSKSTGNVVVKMVCYFNGVILSGQSHTVDEEQPLEKVSFAYEQLAIGAAYSIASGAQAVTVGSWNAIQNRRCSSPDCPTWLY